MALRLIEIIVPGEEVEQVRQLIDEHEVDAYWEQENKAGNLGIKCIISAEVSEKLLDKLEKQFSKHEGFRLVVTAVEASIPRYEKPEQKEELKTERKTPAVIRISREELFTDVSEWVNPTLNFVILMILSSIVAGIGILQDSIAVTIGAMVIAPFMGPNVALAYATTLGDLEMIRKSIITGIVGTTIAVTISVAWGAVDPGVASISAPMELSYSYIVLALVSGVAAVFVVLRGASTSLVGVMVAVALLPPLMKAGLLLGGGYFWSALIVFLVFLANIICINLAGILTFYLTGIRPQNWWEAERAKKQTVKAVTLWLISLMLLALIIFLLK